MREIWVIKCLYWENKTPHQCSKLTPQETKTRKANLTQGKQKERYNKDKAKINQLHRKNKNNREKSVKLKAGFLKYQ